MSGRPPIKVHQYDENGKFIQSYNCMNDAREKYYNDTAYPMFRGTIISKLHELPDGTFLCKSRLGRYGVRFEVARLRNDLLTYGLKALDEPIEILNIDGRIIGEFKNVYLASRVMGITTTQLTKMSTATNLIPKNKLGIRIRFKNAIDE